MIKTISYDQNEIIRNILKLYVPNGIFDLDPTYGNGCFYNVIPAPRYKMDIAPKQSAVITADCTNLPLSDNSLSSIMFDPPFLATSGPSLQKDNGHNAINKRFTVYRNEVELHEMYHLALKEFYRVLTKNGILVFKCQDKVSSGKQYMSHVYIHNMGLALGFYPRDLFILLSKYRISAKWQNANQKHARKYHCYFWVFEKRKPKINI